MTSGFVHDVQTFVDLGGTYHKVHRRKDAPARRVPGLAHRRFRHGWYQSYGKRWTLDDPFPDCVKRRTQRVRDTLGPVAAETYMASLAHDVLDRTWDYADLSREDRQFTRRYWESFHIWLVLNPIILRDWGGVDVFVGRVQRLADGVEIWEEEPEVKVEYSRLVQRARFLLRRDRQLRAMFKQYV